MRLEFHFLDYIWKTLLIGAMSSTIFFTIMITLSVLQKRTRSRPLKWCLNVHYLFLLLALVIGLMLALFGDSELILGCFNRFVETSPSLTLTRFIGGVWLAITAVFVAMDTLRFLRARSRFTKALIAADARALAVFEDLLNVLKLDDRKIRMSFADVEGAPFVHGLIRHHVVVPLGFANASSDIELKSALAHELSHVRDVDSLWMLLELVCRRILFFHPLAYVSARIFSRTVEKAADEQAVRGASIASAAYAQSLVFAASYGQGPIRAPVALNVSRGFIEMKERLLALGECPKTVWWSAPLLLAAPVISFGLSFAEAKSSVTSIAGGESLLCRQVANEKLIETWFLNESATNKCEE